LKTGDKIDWNKDHPSYEKLRADFGDGPFTVRGYEDGAPEDGQWLSIINSEGLAWVKNRWESPVVKVGFKAIPPTFHSQWFVKIGD
jgi:hypothetical protein